jgi:hypothetical protein
MGQKAASALDASSRWAPTPMRRLVVNDPGQRAQFGLRDASF